MNGLSHKSEKYLPWILLLPGGARLLWERFPARFAFFHVLGGENFGWIFWLSGLTGLIWLILRASGKNRSDGPAQKTSPEESIFREPSPAKSSEGSLKTLQNFVKEHYIELIILLLTAASLSVLIHSGFFWDDAVNSTTYLAQKKDSVSIWRHIWNFMYSYLYLGRINVLSIYYYFLFYIENVSVYKALIILSILANQMILRKTLLEFGVPLSGARMGMILIPLMLQTRAYQDPVSGFYCLMQVLTAEMLLCALFLKRWQRSGEKRFFVLSLLFYGMGLMTYEVCFPFLLMICALIYMQRRDFGKALRDSLPFAGLTLLMLAGVVYVRAHFVNYTTYAGVAFNFDLMRILRAAVTQLSAGLPLSYYSAGYQAAVLGNAYPAADFMNYTFSGFLKSITFLDILILLGFLAVLSRITFLSHSASGTRNSDLLILGLSFAVLPMVTVAMSERYQGQLMPGLGYLPVYMQYYGIAILLLWITLRWKTSDGKRAFCLSAFALILLLNLQNNRSVTEILNRSFYEPRTAGESALHGGILDFLPEDKALISVNDRRYIWEANWNNLGLYREFYGNNSKHIPSKVGDGRILENLVNDLLIEGEIPDEEGWMPFKGEDIWVIDYSGKKNQGIARLGRLKYAEINQDSLEFRNVETDSVLYFISSDFPEKETVQYTTPDGIFRQIPVSEQNRIRRSEYGILYQLPENEEILFTSLTLQ